MKKKNFLYLRVLLYLTIIALLVSACAGKPEIHNQSNSNMWTMSAALVDSNGKILETLQLSTEVTLWEQDERSFYQLIFEYPIGYNNSASGQIPAPDDSVPLNWGTGSQIENGISAKSRSGLYVGFIPESECFIIDYDDDKDIYLIAARGENADIPTLWAQLKEHIFEIPNEFPNLN